MRQNFFEDVTKILNFGDCREKFKNVAMIGEKEEKRPLVVGLVASW